MPQQSQTVEETHSFGQPDPTSSHHDTNLPDLSVNQTSSFERSTPRQGYWQTRSGAGVPDPWYQKNFMIGILLALTIWSFYVVVGRVCTPMIHRKTSTVSGRATGVGTLVGFVVLWLLYVWSYIRMISTGPGFAKHHVSKAPPPSNHFSGPSRDYIPYTAPQQSHTDMDAEIIGPDPSEFAPVNDLLAAALRRTTSRDLSSSATLTAQNTSAKQLAIERKSPVKDWREVQRPVPRLEVGARWCRYCQINKPDRTHHCRHCGTCVMQFDHHCMWIGQCVGWANHKYFITFNFWAMCFCAYVFMLLIVVTAKSNDIDGQVVGLIAVSAFFCLITTMMLSAHVYLILCGKSTVESFSGRTQSEKESAVLQNAYGVLMHMGSKRKVRRKWKEEWGGTSVDERWKFGTKWEMWQQEMGKSWIGWILPIGVPLGDGLHFASNPRFGPNGEWLMRKDWPKGVR